MRKQERTELNRETFHAAVDDVLSGLRGDPWLFQKVIACEQEKGKKKMVKKISLGLVLAVILALLTMGTAVALITMREVGQQIAQFEQEDGRFTDWPAERKVLVVGHLMAQGHISETEELRKMANGELTEEEMSRAADNAIAALLGRDAAEGGFLPIMQAVWGPFDAWSHEDRVWYSQVMESVGINNSDKTVYLAPSGRITEQMAVDIARKDAAAAYGVDEAVLDPYVCVVNFQIPEFIDHGEDAKAYWYVSFEAPGDAAGTDRPFGFLELFVDPETGELLESAAEIKQEREELAALYARPDTELYRLADSYGKEAGTVFRYWPLELRARWSKEVAPQVRAIVESGDLTPLLNCGNVDDELIAQCTFTYGLPDEASISQEAALVLAQKALMETYTLPEELFEKYNFINIYFDVTDESAPLWKLMFNPKELDADKLDGGYDSPLLQQCHKVELNAYTGEITHIEQFPFEMLGVGATLEYRLKWY